MNKITEIYIRVDQWIRENPKKATVIGVFVIGFLIGAILF